MTTETTLPSYDRPPVVEVVTAVSFRRLPALSFVHFSTFWKEHLSDAFPQVEEQPPKSSPLGRSGPEGLASELSLRIAGEYPPPRLWFLSENRDELLQVQPDWLACNWRKPDADAKYLRWPSRRTAFASFYTSLESYLRDENLGRLSPERCEVTYVNHIEPGPIWGAHGDLHKILRTVNHAQVPHLEREQIQFRDQFVMKDINDAPIGRIYVTATPGYLDGKLPIYQLELTARGEPMGDGISGILSFMDEGRKAIVRTFAGITTREIQAEWGVQ